MEYHDGEQLQHVGDLTAMAAHRYGPKTAIVDQTGEYSYTELEERACQAANVLVDNGVTSGDRVALFVPNTILFPSVYFGAIKTGAVPVALNLRMDPETLVYILEDAEVDHLVSSPLFAGGLEREGTTIADPAELVDRADVATHYMPGGSGDGTVNYSHARNNADPAFETAPGDRTDVAIQTYTSGTTGRPKGVLLTHENVLATLSSLSRSPAGAVDPDNTVLCVLPMFHTPTMFAIFGTHVYRGATVVLQALPDPAAMLSAVDEHEVTNLPAVPALHSMMWREYRENPEAYDLSSLDVLGAGAAPLPEDTQRSLIDAWGASFTEVWGMTETTSVATVRPATYWQPAGCIGKPVPEVELMLVDPESDETVVPPDELDPTTGPIDQDLPFETEAAVTGEIAIRGPQVFKEYYNRPDATAAAFDDDGWFHTGDIARVDKDGNLWIVERADDLIIVGGENVYPTEVENALYDHPDIAEAAVVAAPHEVKGEAPVAFVVPEAGADLAETEVREYALERVPTYAHPRAVFFVEELPRSGTRKVQRFKLESTAEERLGGPLAPSEQL